MRLLALTATFLLVACGGKSKPAPAPEPTLAEDQTAAEPEPDADEAQAAMPSDAELEVLFGKSLDFLDALAAVIDTNAKDCHAMATAIDQLLTDNQAFVAEATRYKDNKEIDKKGDVYMDAHKDRLDAASTKMQPGLMACASDPDVQVVLQRLDEM